MNETEQKAYDWLLEQGCSENDITFQSHISPDFLVKTSDLSFEVKRLYGNILYFTRKQLENLPKSCIILVFEDETDEPLYLFQLSSFEPSKFPIRICVPSADKVKVLVSFPPEVMTMVDRRAKELGWNRSFYIEQVIRKHLGLYNKFEEMEDALEEALESSSPTVDGDLWINYDALKPKREGDVFLTEEDRKKRENWLRRSKKQ